MVTENVPGLSDYIVGYALAFYAIFAGHEDEMMGLLGLILLLAKLVQELPRAYRVLAGPKSGE